MNTNAILRAARARVACGWTQGAYARTAKGNCIGPQERPAACFCSIGALRRASADAGLSPYEDEPPVAAAVEVLASCIPHDFFAPKPEDALSKVIYWNDRVEQKDVLNAFDKAISATTEVQS